MKIRVSFKLDEEDYAALQNALLAAHTSLDDYFTRQVKKDLKLDAKPQISRPPPENQTPNNANKYTPKHRERELDPPTPH